MNKAREKAIVSAVLYTLDMWLALKPKKSQEIIKKNKVGKEVTVFRTIDTAHATIKCDLTYLDGRTEVTFCNDPLGARYILLRMGTFQTVNIDYRIDMPKNTRKDTVTKTLKEKLTEGFLKYPEDNPYLGVFN